MRFGALVALITAAISWSVVAQSTGDELALDGVWQPIRNQSDPGRAAVPALTPGGATRQNEPIGYSSSRYEADALVIETNRLRENIIDHGSSIMHGRDATVTERYTLSDDDQRLNVTLTIRDLEMFEEPLVLIRSWQSAPGEEILEYGCASIGGALTKY